MTIPSASLLLALLLPADWPCFGGPGRDGVVAAGEWSPRGALEPLWTLEVGRGYSCPSIAGGRMVAFGHSPEDQEDVVACHDARSGEELWWYAFPALDSPTYHGGGTLTTPAIHDGVVYVLNRHGMFHALDLQDGSLLWSRDYRRELELESTFHGYCASPVVVEDHVLLVLGGVAALVERDGGEVVWRTEDHGDGSYTNPTLVRARGRAAAAVMLAQTLYVLALDDGEVLHEFPWELTGNSVHVAAPVRVGQDRLFVSTAYGKGSALVRLGDAREPEVLWTSKVMRNKVTGCYLYEEHLYGFDESMLKCLDLEGNEKWRVRGLGMGALSVVDGRLLVLGSDGELVVAEATPEEFRELHRAQVLEGGVYWTMPVVVDGRVYVRNSEGRLACLDHRTGSGAPAAGAGEPALQAPTAARLFDRPEQRTALDALSGGAAVRLRGTWEISGRGLDPTPASLTLAAPDRWELQLDDRSLVQAHDGERAWTLDPRGNRFHEGEALAEASYLFAARGLLAPALPGDARVEELPVRFGDRRCWKVLSSLPGADGTAPRPCAHYFDVETGRLVGREAEGFSALVQEGVLQVGEATFPRRITLYRADDGQEEHLVLEGGEWLDSAEGLFPVPAPLLRLLRTPEQIEADGAELRERFARELGRYRQDVPGLPQGEIVVEVREGDLVVTAFGDSRRVVLEEEEDGFYPIEGVGLGLAFEADEDGKVLHALLEDPWAPEGPAVHRLPRIE